jgi:UDP-N-acetylglucosamine 4-epimerase
MENLEELKNNKKFKLIIGDIRNIEDCNKAMDGIDLVLHEAALGSVPRSINDPITTNEVNISGFLNLLVAARDAKVKRVVYAASSSTYGDLKSLPKVEDEIGKPLSPYAVTKYVNELYAHVFSVNYNLNLIGLRYFNVFGRRQDPNGAYAAVIPKFISSLIRHEKPIINGDGSFSRDFTYIDNVIQMNHLAALTSNDSAINQVFNTAVGERNSLNQLFIVIKELLCSFQPSICQIEPQYGPVRNGDITHSHASINKAVKLLGYHPFFNLVDGLKESISWYWHYFNK